MATDDEQIALGKRIQGARADGYTWKDAASFADVSVSSAKRAVKAAEEAALDDQVEAAFDDDPIDQAGIALDQAAVVDPPDDGPELPAVGEETDAEWRFSGIPDAFRHLDELERIQAQRIHAIVIGKPIPSHLYDVRVKTGLEIERAHYVRGKLKIQMLDLADAPLVIAGMLVDMRARGG